MTEPNKQPKRRWFRFSLRTFLIVLTIFCVWFGLYLYRVEQQREAVKWVLGHGGTVYYDYELDDKYFDGDSHPTAPKWLLNMLGVDFFSTVTQVSDFNTELIDVTMLADLTKLEFLLLDNTQVCDLTPLVGLTNLRFLDLSDTQVSDITPLAGLTNLDSLFLFQTQVSDVAPLAGLVKLEYLNLSNSQVSDLTSLAGLTNLDVLHFSDTQVSDVTPLAGLTNLTALVIHYARVSHEDIEKLKQSLPNCTIYH